MSNEKDKNQNVPEEEPYNGILGDFQEQEAKEAEQAAAEISESQEAENSKNNHHALKFAGVTVVSVAIIGCLGVLGVHLWKNSDSSTSDANNAQEDSLSNLQTENDGSEIPVNTTAAVYSKNLEVSQAAIQFLYEDYVGYYESYLSYYGVDTETSLKEQELPDDSGQTWYDYFVGQAENVAVQLLTFCEAANDAGFTMSEEEIQTMEEIIAGIDTSLYSEAVTEEGIREIMELESLASAYYTYVEENIEISDDELQAYYEENHLSFDTCSIMGFSISYDVEEEEDTDTEDDADSEDDTSGMTQEEAKTLADGLEAASSPEDFEAQVREILIQYEGYTEEEVDDMITSIYNDDFSYTEGFAVSEWAFADGTNVGDTYLSENEGYYSIYLLTGAPSLDEEATVNVRHILFSTSDHTEELDEDADEDAVAAAEEAALTECQQLAEEVLAKWESGDKTEESFAELANTYSEDPGSNTAGGLYEDVYEGEMVTEFNDWCFDSSRKVGDTGIVETSYGFHVMYFSGEGDPLWKSTARADLQEEKMETWYAEQEQLWTVYVNDEIVSQIED